MKSKRLFECFAVAMILGLAAGCASTDVTDTQLNYIGQLPRPNTIWVYRFAATPSDMPGNASIAGQFDPQIAQTPSQIAAGRQLGSEIASQLIGSIMGMGLPARLAFSPAQPKINDLVIRGYLLSVNQGNSAARVGIGLGAGASELKTLVEVYQMTPQGLRKLGSGVADSTGSKTPGGAAGLATLLATGNPVGLIVSSGVKVYNEEDGSSTVQGRAKQTAQEIAGRLQTRFQQQGWI
jgi:hypothetical protein